MHPNQLLSDTLRWLCAALGGVIAILEPTLPYILICTLMILADCAHGVGALTPCAQGAPKPAEFAAFDAFAEACKAEARKELAAKGR